MTIFSHIYFLSAQYSPIGNKSRKQEEKAQWGQNEQYPGQAAKISVSQNEGWICCQGTYKKQPKWINKCSMGGNKTFYCVCMAEQKGNEELS